MKVLQLFVAGTDTSVGKTRVTAGLLEAAQAQGLKTAGMKPVASGCFEKDGRMMCDDALQISLFCSRSIPYGDLNPYCLKAAVSPHIAARWEGQSVDPNWIVVTAANAATGADVFLVEGAGGWLAPIDERQTMADIARALDLPVLLVVGLRLGCLNHARLTRESIASSGLRLAGWIANCLEPEMPALSENLATLTQILDGPPLAVLEHRPDRGHDAAQLGTALAALRSSLG
jgi:dethiobiotin synthetase